MKKSWFFVCWLILLIHDGHAEISQSDKELDSVKSNIDTVKQNLQRIELEKNSLQNQLADIEKRYGETAALLKALHSHIEYKRRSLIKIRQDMQSFRNEIDKQSKELADQIKAAYAMGQQEKLKLIFNQQDPALSSRMMVYYHYLNKARLTKLTNIEESVKRLDQLNKQKQAETELLEQNLEQKKSEQIALNDFRKQRNELLVQLRNDFSSSEQQLSHLQESENKLMGLITALSNGKEAIVVGDTATQEFPPPLDDNAQIKDDFPRLDGDFSELKGKLPWPVRGKLAQKFGSPRSGGSWDGVLIDAKEGSEIRAVTKGKVAYADWLRGYGLLMIIDHGQDYMSLYAFNQSLYKRKGESVEVGDVIASVGQSDGRSQPGLYFEIRKKGAPVNPLEWCKK